MARSPHSCATPRARRSGAAMHRSNRTASVWTCSVKLCTHVLLAGLVLFPEGMAAGETIVASEIGAEASQRVSTRQELQQALARATGGEVIELAPGDYGTLSLRAPLAVFDQTVVLRSAEPGSPATFTRIELRGARNLSLEDLSFHYVPKGGDGTQLTMLEIRGNARGISVRGCEFTGEAASAEVGADPSDARAVAERGGLVSGAFAGLAIYVHSAEGITVADSSVTGVYRGFAFENVANLEVSGNRLHDIRSDAMTFGELQGATIEGNVLSDLHPWRHAEAPARGDHPDLMQFWTTNSQAATRNVVIRGNLLMQRRTEGESFAQGIFMRNPKAEADAQGKDFFYRDITIADNVIYNGHINSLVVGETLGLTVTGNLLLADPAAGSRKVDTPILSIARRSEAVTVRGNVLPELSAGYSTIRGYAPLDDGQSLGWQVEGNSFTRLDREAGMVLGENGAELYGFDKLIDEIGEATAPGATAAAGRLARKLIAELRAPVCANSPDAPGAAAGCL